MIEIDNIPKVYLCDIPNNFTGVCYIKELSQIEFWENGLVHKLDGPAIIHVLDDGEKYVVVGEDYYISGISYSKHNFYSTSIVIEHKLNKILDYK